MKPDIWKTGQITWKSVAIILMGNVKTVRWMGDVNLAQIRKRRKKMEKLYIHDLASEILDMYECTLADQDVVLKSPEDDDRDEDSACLYGSTYSDLFDETEDELAGVCDIYSIPYERDVYASSVAISDEDKQSGNENKFRRYGKKMKQYLLSDKSSISEKESFLGYQISSEVLEDLEAHIEEALSQMPDTELERFYKKFVTEQKLYTHDFAAKLVELFEELLSRQGIILASSEDAEKEPDNGACLYGTTYSNLLDGVEEKLIAVCEEYAVPYVDGMFSGNF